MSDGVAMALGNRLPLQSKAASSLQSMYDGMFCRLQTLEEQVAEVAALAPLLAGLRPLPTLDMKELQSPCDKVGLQESVGLFLGTGQQWEHDLRFGLRQRRGFDQSSFCLQGMLPQPPRKL